MILRKDVSINVDEEYLSLEAKVEETALRKRDLIAELKNTMVLRDEAKKMMLYAKSRKNDAASDYREIVRNLKYKDASIKQAFNEYEEYHARAQRTVNELEGNYAYEMTEYRRLNAEGIMYARKGDMPSKIAAFKEAKTHKQLMIAVGEKIKSLRAEIVERKRQAEETASGNLDFREARVELDRTRLEYDKAAREYRELSDRITKLRDVINKAAKEHNRFVTEFWHFLMRRIMQNQEMVS